MQRQPFVFLLLLYVMAAWELFAVQDAKTRYTVPEQTDAVLPQKLYFSYDDSSRYRIESLNIQTVYINDVVQILNNSIRNNILVHILERSSDAIVIEGAAELVERGQLLEKTQFQYYITPQGYTGAEHSESLTFIKNMPVFPLEELVPNDRWQERSIEQLYVSQLDSTISVETMVEYTLLGYDTLPWERFEVGEVPSDPGYPVILIQYAIVNYRHKGTQGTFAGELLLNAEFELLLWWNDKQNRPEYYSEEYDIRMRFDDSYEERYVGEVESHVYPIIDPIPDPLEDMLRESFAELDVPVELERNRDGIKISLFKVFFKPDSAEPLGDLERDLQGLVDTLKTQKPRRILIEGHTARFGTEKMQKQLSVDRARVIRNYLQNALGWDDRFFLYRGYGAERPVASNETQEERKKNRRVEITILEN